MEFGHLQRIRNALWVAAIRWHGGRQVLSNYITAFLVLIGRGLFLAGLQYQLTDVRFICHSPMHAYNVIPFYSVLQFLSIFY